MQKYLNIEKIIFKVVQMKFLTMHINNKKIKFDIFTVGNVLNIFMEHDLNVLMIFGITEKIDNFDSYNVLLAIATNIAVLLMTAFVLQGHNCKNMSYDDDRCSYQSIRCASFILFCNISHIRKYDRERNREKSRHGHQSKKPPDEERHKHFSFML